MKSTESNLLAACHYRTVASGVYKRGNYPLNNLGVSVCCLKSGSSLLQGEETSGGKNDKVEENGGKTERAMADLGW